MRAPNNSEPYNITIPTLPNPFVAVLRRGLQGWWRPSALIVKDATFTFLDARANEVTIRETLGGPARELFRASSGLSGLDLQVLVADRPSEPAPEQFVDFGNGVERVCGPIVLVQRTNPGGYKTSLSQEALNYVSLEDRDGIPGRVLSVRPVPKALHQRRIDHSLRNSRTVLIAIAAFVAWWLWRAAHREHPDSLVGTWILREVQQNGWDKTDTLFLHSGGAALRHGRYVWRGKPSELGKDVGMDLEALDLSGRYTWGVRRKAFKDAELCFHVEDENAAPLGCTVVTIARDTIVLGRSRFVRISR